MVTVSLCMIVKNEEAVLGRILGQMEHVADEIIVVDTGSTDRTKEIASHYGAQVFDYEWVQDFAAARNFACSKATMDYWMWLDADDVVRTDQQEALLELKKTMDPAVDLVMMKYLTGFDENGKVTFSYNRERWMKNNGNYIWHGKVHEVVIPSGNIAYSPIEIEHRKVKAGDSDRNLNIYEKMIADGETLEPRHQFYFGRELYYHQRYQEAIQVFETFLQHPDAWVENKIDACLQLSYCYSSLEQREQSLTALFHSFIYDLPRAEICCQIGRHLLEKNAYRQAIYWYERALAVKRSDQSGGFVQEDCHDYIPYIQLCVCYDRLGDQKQAYVYHKKAKKLKPEAKAVQLNEQYFKKLR